LEVSQSFKDAPLSTCPIFGGDLRKVFSSVGIMFKGSGFYRTDSRGAGRTESTPAKAGAEKGDSSGEKAGAAEKSGGDKSGSTGETSGTKAASSDGKPAAKPDVAKSDVAKTA
jgi:predicted nucleic acid-binding Zn ribbon protein